MGYPLPFSFVFFSPPLFFSTLKVWRGRWYGLSFFPFFFPADIFIFPYVAEKTLFFLLRKPFGFPYRITKIRSSFGLLFFFLFWVGELLWPGEPSPPLFRQRYPCAQTRPPFFSLFPFDDLFSFSQSWKRDKTKRSWGFLPSFFFFPYSRHPPQSPFFPFLPTEEEGCNGGLPCSPPFVCLERSGKDVLFSLFFLRLPPSLSPLIRRRLKEEDRFPFPPLLLFFQSL